MEALLRQLRQLLHPPREPEPLPLAEELPPKGALPVPALVRPQVPVELQPVLRQRLVVRSPAQL